MWNTTFLPSPVVDPARAEALMTEAHEAWLGRRQEANVRRAIALWQAALEADSSRVDAWAHLAQAQYFLAYAHLEDRAASDALVTQTYLDALASTERGLLVLMPDLVSYTERGMLGSEGLMRLDRRAVPLLYWRASALGRWSHRDGVNTRVDMRGEVRASMERIAQLDRDYNFAGADRTLAAALAILPPTLGGDIERARAHFLYAIALHPRYLGSRVRYAIEVAVRDDRRDVFIEQLEWVLAADPDALPEAGPENRIEQRRAREALDRIEYYFD